MDIVAVCGNEKLVDISRFAFDSFHHAARLRFTFSSGYPLPLPVKLALSLRFCELCLHSLRVIETETVRDDACAAEAAKCNGECFKYARELRRLFCISVCSIIHRVPQHIEPNENCRWCSRDDWAELTHAVSNTSMWCRQRRIQEYYIYDPALLHRSNETSVM